MFLVHCFDNQILPEEISDEAIVEYLTKTKSQSYLKQQIGTIKNFYQHVLGIPYRLAHIPSQKNHRIIPDYLSPEETEAVFNSVKNKKQRCILKLQYACALRVHEVVKIKLIDFIKKYDSHSGKYVFDLKINGKGGSDDIIPVPDETMAEVIDYMESCQPALNEHLFPGQFSVCYSTRSVQIIMKRAMAALGITKKGSTHILRHSRATHLLQNGVGVLYVKNLLRHKNIKTTELYLHHNTSDLRVAFSKADGLMRKQLAQNTNPLKEIKSA